MERTRRKSKTSKGRGTRRSGGRRRAWNKEAGRERGLKDERRRGGRRTSRSCRRRWRLLCTGRCSVSTRNRTGEEGEDTRRADGAKEEKKRKKDRRREGREGGGEREGTGGLVAATLRYDSRLSYPPHYLVLLPSLPPPLPSHAFARTRIHPTFSPYESLQPSTTSSFASLRRPSFGPNNLLSRRRVHRRGQLRTQTYARARNCLVRLSFSVCTYSPLSFTPHRSLLLTLGLFLLPRCLSLSHFFSPACIKPRPHARARHARSARFTRRAIKPPPPSSPSRSSQATSSVHLYR